MKSKKPKISTKIEFTFDDNPSDNIIIDFTPIEKKIKEIEIITKKKNGGNTQLF
jgi:hypothetical protein